MRPAIIFLAVVLISMLAQASYAGWATWWWLT
jgi:hypothetical protein